MIVNKNAQGRAAGDLAKAMGRLSKLLTGPESRDGPPDGELGGLKDNQMESHLH